MKKKTFVYFILYVIGVLFILLFLKCSFKENLDSKEIIIIGEKKGQMENLKDLNQKGYVIIEDKSFNIDFANYPNSRFISGTIEANGLFKAVFYLVDRDENIIYKFPEFYGNHFGYIYDIKAVSINDINDDNLKDVIVIAEYMVGFGKKGIVPHSISGIYIQKDKGFITNIDLNKKINTQHDNKTIQGILRYIKKHINHDLKDQAMLQD